VDIIGLNAHTWSNKPNLHREDMTLASTRTVKVFYFPSLNNIPDVFGPVCHSDALRNDVVIETNEDPIWIPGFLHPKGAKLCIGFDNIKVMDGSEVSLGIDYFAWTNNGEVRSTCHNLFGKRHAHD
jgi:hypothetical protein